MMIPRMRALAGIFLLGWLVTMPAGKAWAGWDFLGDNDQVVVATMGRVELTLAELQRVLDHAPAQVKAQVVGDPEQLRQVIEEELLKKVLLSQAKEADWQRRDEVKYLMERAQNQVLMDHYVASQTEPAPGFPDEARIKNSYKKNLERFRVPAKVHIAQIYLAVKPGADKKNRQKVIQAAQKLLRQAQAQGADFASLAKSHSQHQPSAGEGGDMGWVAFPNLLPEIKRSLDGMKPGEIKGPVASSQGVHIIKLLGVQKATYHPYKEVRSTLVKLLKRQKTRENKRNYLKKMKKNDPVSVFHDRLDALK
ncbi:MAG: peptidylprolyl isomerase [Magnetococcales bacterium]|nr:peptidylprolyl isomerase [Magnetococcales bacterium]